MEGKTSKKTVRSLEIDPEFDEEKFAIGWHFSIPEAFKDCLDIKLTTRMENKQPVLKTTQGQFFSFSEGQIIYDSPKGYLPWPEALQHIRRYCVVLSASPNQRGENGELINGQVQFQLKRPNQDKTGVEVIETYRLTQNDFVQFLKTGEMLEEQSMEMEHERSYVHDSPLHYAEKSQDLSQKPIEFSSKSQRGIRRVGQMEKKKSPTGQKTYTERSISRLQGILSGISADKKLNNHEFAGLYKWLNENEFLREHHPFCELTQMLDEALEDGVIDGDERDDLLTWCRDYTDANSLVKTVETEAIRQLHGFLHGIVIDNKINDKEIYGLQEWLGSFSEYKSIWPFAEVWGLLEAILADGIVDEEERQYLVNFCQEFSERPIDGAILHDDIYKKAFMKNDAPILKPVTALCDHVEKIIFENNTFCLTGAAKSGKRQDIEQAIEMAGGIMRPRVDKSLNYLVIGAKSSPCWVYSTYGRKVEQAMQIRQNETTPLILHEETFMPHLRAAIKA